MPLPNEGDGDQLTAGLRGRVRRIPGEFFPPVEHGVMRAGIRLMLGDLVPTAEIALMRCGRRRGVPPFPRLLPISFLPSPGPVLLTLALQPYRA